MLSINIQFTSSLKDELQQILDHINEPDARLVFLKTTDGGSYSSGRWIPAYYNGDQVTKLTKEKKSLFCADGFSFFILPQELRTELEGNLINREGDRLTFKAL